MPIFENQHRSAVLASIAVVNTVTPAHLDLPTPCAEWTVADLLAHMTAQHRGFAAAARGRGADPGVWHVEPLGSDPAGAYKAAAEDVLQAFSAAGTDETLFALPEFGADVTAPGATAMGFHFVDYVVHGWDIATALAVPWQLPDGVLGAVAPLVFAVPDGDFRDAAGSPFGRALPIAEENTMARILRHLGRDPHWAPPHAQAG